MKNKDEPSLKKLVITLFLFTAATISYAQRNVVSIRPANLFMGLYGISYERTVLRQFSASIYIDIQNTNIYQDRTIFYARGWGFIPEARVYLSANGAPKGVFIGAYVPFRYISSKLRVENNYTITKTDGSQQQIFGKAEVSDNNYVTGFGLMLGSHVIIARFISIEFMIGGAYTTGLLKEQYNVTAVANDGSASGSTVLITDRGLYNVTRFMPRIGINLGISF